MECLLGRQAWGGRPGWCPTRQQPTYQPAPSQPCPALGRPEPNSPLGGSLDSRGGIWLRAPAWGVGEAAPTLAYVSLVDPTLLGSRRVLSH